MNSITAYLASPALVGPPDEDHLPGTRSFQGIPSLAITPEGRLWAVWYAGPTPSVSAARSARA